jgi:hypothetical protein
MDKKTKEKNWRKEQTTQYLLRFLNATGVPEALNNATKATGEAASEYMKKSIVQRLQRDGFLSGDVVINLNKQRHIEKVKRLSKYVEQEMKKIK